MPKFKLKARKISEDAKITQDEEGNRYIVKPSKRKSYKNDGTINAYFGF